MALDLAPSEQMVVLPEPFDQIFLGRDLFGSISKCSTSPQRPTVQHTV
jgi:hypothetical protein